MKRKYYWLIGILGLTTLAVMVLFGRIDFLQISEPLDIGFGQSIDVFAGIVSISLILSGIIIGIIYYRDYSNQEKKKMKK